MSNFSDVEKFFAKAGCRRRGPQATARRLWGRIAYLFSGPTAREILVEWEHVRMGEGRHKLDSIARDVLPRLARDEKLGRAP